MAIESGLIVPIDLMAYCVGNADNTSSGFTGSTTDFTNQTGTSGAFLGSNVAIGFNTVVNGDVLPPPNDKLGPGVHLHWALPDALTKGSSGTGSVSFGAVPNRWMVNRFLLTANTVQRKSWIVLSDILNTDKSSESIISLPIKTTSPTGDHRFVGQIDNFDASWQEPVIPDEKLFKTLTGAELSPVSNGDMSFASYYPNSRSIFGYYDALSDVTTTPASLMYQVIGWFSDATNDPIKEQLTLDDIQKNFGWTVDKWEGSLGYSLYNGTTQSIVFDPNKNYISNPSTTTVNLDACIGNSPSEAISAYLGNELYPTVSYFEQLLNAYQQGLLNEFKQPSADQLSILEEEMEENRFRTVAGGYIYTVVQKKTEGGQSVDVEVTNLPIKLADDLNELNILSRQYQMAMDQGQSYRWQLFSDWYRIFMADKQEQQRSATIAFNKLNGWNEITEQQNQLYGLFQSQLSVVQSQLSTSQTLKQIPAPRYYQSLEPALLLSGPELPPVNRYGNNGRYDKKNGYLFCKLNSQNLISLTAYNKTVNANDFSSVALPAQTGLPATDVFNSLILEACLLNTSLLSLSLSNPISQQDLIDALLDQSKIIKFQGTPPSPLGLTFWDNNTWFPVFVHWQVPYLPLFSTGKGDSLANYNAQFFTANYTINQDEGGIIAYTPSQSEGGIDIDPAQSQFTQGYAGSAVLTSSPIRGFIKQISQSKDPTLQQILTYIKGQNVLVHTLSGFNPSLMMKMQGLKLPIKSVGHYPPPDFSNQVGQIVGTANDFPPNFNGYYNPIRAGYLQVKLKLIDVFGQVRNVNFTSFMPAESMKTYYKGKLENNIAYLPPRLSQPASLQFRWIAADSSGYDEMNSHPATTPICGWILPNHLDGSLFFYNEQGESLGTLYLNGDKTQILWQSAPGNDNTINQTIEEVMQNENRQLSDFSIALSRSKPQFYIDFYKTIDTVNAFINPDNDCANNGISVLVGRPLALTQVSLGLNVQGLPSYNQSWSVLTLPDQYCETDNDFTKVTFPVILGNLSKINDGLIGYFKLSEDQKSYDFSTFYSKGSNVISENGVVVPNQDNICLSLAAESKQKVLMLIDPRASIHATSGILPVKEIQIPSYMYTDTLKTLEMTFLTTPVFRGSSELKLPLPKEQGYAWSFVEEYKDTKTSAIEWVVDSDIAVPALGSIWTYTPQVLTEGWLRLNPLLLLFNVFNTDGKPVVQAGVPNALSLKIKNTGRSITFLPGTIVNESQPKNGSIFYIHFRDLLAEEDIPKVKLSLSGWTFSPLSDDRYKNYWGATPTNALTLENGDELSISMNVPSVITTKVQTTISFDYFGITHINDGVYQDVLNVNSNN